MQALVFTGPGRVELLTVPDPSPRAGESLIRVMASGICGSELHGFRSVGMRVPPLVMGHEFAGVTEAGARVVVNPLLSCGSCDSCTRGLPQVCRTRELIGVHRAGGFGDLVSVPDGTLHELPDDIGWSEAALIEPLANAVHAWGLAPADTVSAAVIGAGAIGLACAQVGRARGVEVVVTEPSPHRRGVAQGLELTLVDTLTQEYDVVIDAVGIEATRRQSVEHCAPGGTSVWIGLAEDATVVSGAGVVRFEHRIVGSFAYTDAEFSRAVSLASELDLSWTTQISMSESEQTFMSLANGETRIVKAVIVADPVVDSQRATS